TIPSGIDSGREAAGLLLGRPAHERPDGLIVGDDIVAMALAQVLRLESDYAPAIATITHQAAPLTFALPVLHFELNDAVFASTAVRMLTDRLCDPDLPDRVELIAPRLIDEDAAHMSWAGHCEAKTQPSHGMVE
ncbi:MAG: hypothetical protein K9N51_07725, partial [Candidatus Pacebacteria bacterium]|nr:hypothetical protein [Candidatus Paceibacterota bacterium]